MAVVAKSTVRVAGSREMLIEGRVYDDSHPMVRSRPELFESPEAHQRRKARPRNTADLGRRSMSSRHLTSPPIETATAEPGELRDINYWCDADGCDWHGTSERAMKIHRSKAHA